MKLDIKKNIAYNWKTKVICIVLSILIYTFYQSQTVENKVLTVPLNISTNGIVLPVNSYPSSVRVQVASSPSSLPQILEDDITAILDIDNYVNEGQFDVPVNLMLSDKILHLPDNVEIKKIKPNTVNLTLELKEDKYVPITPDVTGIPQRGYSIDSKEITSYPSTVLVTGAKSIIDKIGNIHTEKIDVTGTSRSMRVSTKLRNENKNIKIDLPDEVIVSYTIIPTPSTVHYENIQVAPFNLDEKFVLTKPIPPVSFNLNGTELMLANYTMAADDVYIDCSNITEPGKYELPILFFMPYGLTVEDKSADKTSITVALKGQDAEEPIEEYQE